MPVVSVPVSFNTTEYILHTKCKETYDWSGRFWQWDNREKEHKNGEWAMTNEEENESILKYSNIGSIRYGFELSVIYGHMHKWVSSNLSCKTYFKNLPLVITKIWLRNPSRLRIIYETSCTASCTQNATWQTASVRSCIFFAKINCVFPDYLFIWALFGKLTAAMSLKFNKSFKDMIKPNNIHF